jgi:hypothetical protein
MVDGGSEWIFGGMARVSKGPMKRPRAGDSRRRPEVLGAPLTWLFLVRLRPRRARLRFTRHGHCRIERIEGKPSKT